MSHRTAFSPFTTPILFFAAAIAVGTVILQNPASHPGAYLSWVDALFTATSATCVTGLIVVDTGSFFSPLGQTTILVLIQLGGLGIMTYTSLVFYLWRRRIRLTDRISLGQGLLHDPGFHLGRFLVRIVAWTFVIEFFGALGLYLLAPAGFSPFGAVFHSISAFCNAGFSLHEDSLMGFSGAWGVNLIFIALIVLGGIGFTVLVELERGARHLARWRSMMRTSWYTRVVVRTTIGLIVGGWLALYLSEFFFYGHALPQAEALLTSLFQSVTCRTAGFNTLDIGSMTNVSLLIMIILMFVGGSPGSCAGGVKTTTFRALLGFAWAQIRGRDQAVVEGFALDRQTLSKALMLIVFAVMIVAGATLVLSFTEGGDVPHYEARGLFLEILFEVVSAFATVGLSTGLTAKLTVAGKLVISVLMFLGRLGPVLFLTAVQSLHEQPHYRWPEETMLIG